MNINILDLKIKDISMSEIIGTVEDTFLSLRNLFITSIEAIMNNFIIMLKLKLEIYKNNYITIKEFYQVNYKRIEIKILKYFKRKHNKQSNTPQPLRDRDKQTRPAPQLKTFTNSLNCGVTK